MTPVLRVIVSGLAMLLCGYVLAISLGVAACATTDSGTGDVRPSQEP